MGSYNECETKQIINVFPNQTFIDNLFKNIKSKYILEQIMTNLSKKKVLKIVRYNKRIQSKLGLSIIDYKDYFEKLSPIIMEIIPNKKYKKTSGIFINLNQNEEKYYHMYYNDNKEEIKIDDLTKYDKVKKFVLKIDYQINSFKELFHNNICIKSINFIKFNRNNIINMSGMFYGCSLLKELNLSHFKTDNVNNMSDMFYGCASLKELDLSNFDTNNVTNMNNMFNKCASLKELDLSNFNTTNVTSMACMFFECSSLKKLNLSNFNTNKVVYMTSMFYGCSSFKELDLSNFNTNNASYIAEMFRNCSSLKILNIINFNTNNALSINKMFEGCSYDLKVKMDISLNKGIKKDNPIIKFI